jgi:hypothetical protein
MKKTALAAVLGVMLFAGGGYLASQQNSEDAKFVKWVETYFDEYWKFHPTAGTLAGFTKFSDKLEDWSESRIEKYLEQLDKFNAELVNKIAKDKLSPDVQVDFDLVRENLDMTILRLEKIAPQQTNPLIYNEVLYHTIRALLVKNSSPLDARLTAATARAKAIPDFVKQAKENLKTPPKEYTDEAVRQLTPLLDLYKNEIFKLIEAAGADVKAKFGAEHAKAVAALEDYAKFVQGDLLARSTGNFRLGEAHQRIFQLTTGGSIMMNELGARATADTTNLRREMFKVCFSYYKIMDPEFDIENPPDPLNKQEQQLINKVVPHVLNKIKSNQPTKEEWLSKVKSNAEAIKAFLDQTKLLDVPAELPAIEVASPFNRDFQLVDLVLPAAYDSGAPVTLRVNPYLDTLSGEAAASFLDEYTNYLLPYWTIQNVYPGSYAPAVAALKNTTFVRRLYPNIPLLKGWPLYAQDMFVYAGFNFYDLKMRLNELKLKLRALVAFQVDASVHEGNMAKERAINHMMSYGLQSAAEAERMWNFIVLHPGEAAQAYVGYQEILDMEKDYKQAKGAAFSKKEFLTKLTSFGPLPLRVLKAKLLQ